MSAIAGEMTRHVATLRPSRTDYRPFGSLRFILAVAVVISHSTPLEAPNSFLAHVGLGNPAVMGFFVLSGYIIAEAASSFYYSRPFAFAANRFWRIAPPYWAALLMSIAVHALLLRAGMFTVADVGTPTDAMFAARNLWANFIAIFPRPRVLHVDVPGGFYGFVRFYWAVYIEVVFYGAVFLVAYIVARHKSMMAAPIVAATGALAWHCISEYVRPLPLAVEGSFAPYFVLGASLYAATRETSKVLNMSIGATYVLCLVHFSRYIQGKVELNWAWVNGAFEPAHFSSLMLFAAVPPLVVALSRRRIGLAAEKIDQKLGDLTYSVYLNHFTVLVVAYSLNWRFAGVTLVILALSVVLSLALIAGVERPLKPLRNRIRGVPLQE